MNCFPEGEAIVYCEGAFGTTNGKTAHGLVRRSHRYHVLSVVDSCLAGTDAGLDVDGKFRGIPVLPTVDHAVEVAKSTGFHPTLLVVGIAPDGGRLTDRMRQDILGAIQLGLNVDCGLHDFISEDQGIAFLARRMGVTLRDIRKPPERSTLHFFSGKIEEVEAFKIAVLGTDSAVGKRTTAWLLVDALRSAGQSAELIGTGQTAWMQGAQYGIVIDSLVNDFVAGEIEHAIWTAWQETKADILVIEGQGSLMNPAYPGGFEILAAGRPDVIVLQHAPGRKEYDGFPGHPLHPIGEQILAIEVISGRPVVAITINRGGLRLDEVREICAGIQQRTALLTCDPLRDNCRQVADAILSHLRKRPTGTV
jgi:uncharacterized NAD-dependent epimerase/dehydratase family protein